jgi:excisionase family DNA binding protein
MPEPEDWLSINEGAEYVGVTTATLARKIKERYLTAYRMQGGRTLRLRRADLDALFQPIGGHDDAA